MSLFSEILMVSRIRFLNIISHHMAVIKKSRRESGESVSVNESRMESKLLRFTTLLLMPIRMGILRTVPSIHWQVGRTGFGHAGVDGEKEEAEEAVATMATCICTKILRDSAIRTQLLFDVARVRLLSAPQFPWQASKCWSKRDRARCEGEAERPVIRGKGKKRRKNTEERAVAVVVASCCRCRCCQCRKCNSQFAVLRCNSNKRSGKRACHIYKPFTYIQCRPKVYPCL